MLLKHLQLASLKTNHIQQHAKNLELLFKLITLYINIKYMIHNTFQHNLMKM